MGSSLVSAESMTPDSHRNGVARAELQCTLEFELGAIRCGKFQLARSIPSRRVMSLCGDWPTYKE